MAGRSVLPIRDGQPRKRVTVQCVCESALAIVCETEELPKVGGVLTPSVGLGEALVSRLHESGMTILVA